MVLDPSDTAATVLDPAHETVVTEVNGRANQRVDNEISLVFLKAKRVIGRKYVTAADATCLNDSAIMLRQSACRKVACIADCPLQTAAGNEAQILNRFLLSWMVK